MTTDAEIEARFWDHLEKAPLLMIGLEDHKGVHSVPMTPYFDDRHGPIWFYTSSGNRLVEGLAHGGNAMAQFVAKDHELFACIRGSLTIDNDRAVIDRFWSKEVAVWYNGGKQDPSLTMLRFDTRSAEIWSHDVSIAGAFTMLFGGDLRKTAQDNHAEVAL